MRFGERLFRNEATVISPTGEFLGVYGKDHSVLFGGKTSPTRGTYPVYPTPLGRLGGLVGAAGLCLGRPAQPTYTQIKGKSQQELAQTSHIQPTAWGW
ncbi:hypothetical protein [Meiothermus cerbereus]|uniref:hypothetical protein n=1 Tax=Meiothermus cerbereus TaxID=65552 RepID=UPI003EEAD473